MDLSRAFIWRGSARYWEAPKRPPKPKRCAPRRPCVEVPSEIYAGLARLAKQRRVAIRKLVDEIFAGL